MTSDRYDGQAATRNFSHISKPHRWARGSRSGRATTAYLVLAYFAGPIAFCMGSFHSGPSGLSRHNHAGDVLAKAGMQDNNNNNSNDTSGLLYDFCPGKTDFRNWKKSGITRKTLEMALGTGGWRFKIIDGRLYVGTDRFLPQDGEPTKRDFFGVMGLLRLTEKYGKEIPNVEFVLQNHDEPKVKKAGKNSYIKKYLSRGKVKSAATSNPPLVFATYVSKGQKVAWDIPWPQFTFWGESLGKRMSDPPWKHLRKELVSSWTPFSSRNASLFWSGAPNNPARHAAIKCKHDNFFINRPGMTGVFGAGKCGFKYLMYADGKFSSSSILPIIGCGSVPLIVKSPWTNTWSRCLQPYKHYLPITENPKAVCADLKAKFDWAQANPEKAEQIALNVQKLVKEELSMDSVYDYMLRRLQDYSSLMKFKPVVRPKSDEPIANFDGLVKVLSGVMKRMGLKERDRLLDRFVAFNKGDRCCTSCRDNPAFQHLCPGKDLGWLDEA